ncbi:MAG TPA: DegT/DnrJ/EryC1/StrS family aminotransferase [Syntrophorhabdaceae bacterium]|nr:DegT/DnrJ/EryC1/StrS family aminotransferase [Syntrophorhabdaceae bacterium]
MDKIPQVFPWVGAEELSNITKVIENNWLTEGPFCKEFSDRLNAMIGCRYGVFAPNGTLALFLGLLALGIGPGDEVIVPDCTFIGSANAVILTGAKPVFADVSRETFQIDMKNAEGLITGKTRAIMPVHLFGMSSDMKAVMDVAGRHGIKVIEDAAQGIGVTYEGKHTGSFGDVGCFSFFADKTITIGEGGYVVTGDEKIYENLLYLRNQGRLDRGSFIHPAIGYNFRITDIQAAIGLAQLEKLPVIIKRKLEIYRLYREGLDGISEVTFPGVEKGSNHVPFRVVILVPDAGKLMEYLDKRVVQTRSFFYPLHRQPCFKNGGSAGYDGAGLVNSVYGYDHGLCLPIYPSLSEADIRRICGRIREFYGE